MICTPRGRPSTAPVGPAPAGTPPKLVALHGRRASAMRSCSAGPAMSRSAGGGGSVNTGSSTTGRWRARCICVHPHAAARHRRSLARLHGPERGRPHHAQGGASLLGWLAGRGRESLPVFARPCRRRDRRPDDMERPSSGCGRFLALSVRAAALRRSISRFVALEGRQKEARMSSRAGRTNHPCWGATRPRPTRPTWSGGCGRRKRAA